MLMMRFSDRMVAERVQTFWAAMQRAEFIGVASAEAATYRRRAIGGWLPGAACGRGAGARDTQRA